MNMQQLFDFTLRAAPYVGIAVLLCCFTLLGSLVYDAHFRPSASKPAAPPVPTVADELHVLAAQNFNKVRARQEGRRAEVNGEAGRLLGLCTLAAKQGNTRTFESVTHVFSEAEVELIIADLKKKGLKVSRRRPDLERGRYRDLCIEW